VIKEEQLNALKVHCKIHAKGLADDLFQHVVLTVLESNYKEDNLLPLMKRIAFYQLYTKNSKFNKLYNPRKIDAYSYERIQEQESIDEESIEKIEKIIQEQPQTKRELFNKEVWFEKQKLGSFNKLAIATGIKKHTLIKAARRYEANIRHNHF